MQIGTAFAYCEESGLDPGTVKEVLAMSRKGKAHVFTDPVASPTGFPFKVPDRLPTYLRQFTAILSRTSGIRRAGSAALDLVDVAMGRFDGFWELWLAPWDIAAGALLVRESGGMVTDIEGNPDVVRPGAVVAGNPSMHAWLLGVLKD